MKLLGKKFGFLDEQIAKCLRITRKTLHNWKKLYPEFLHAIRTGKRATNFIWWKIQCNCKVIRQKTWLFRWTEIKNTQCLQGKYQFLEKRTSLNSFTHTRADRSLWYRGEIISLFYRIYNIFNIPEINLYVVLVKKVKRV